MAGIGPQQEDSSSSLLNPGGLLTEINVTPFVDVMLVLLIIFMVSAPLMQQGIQVDLPKTKSPTLSDQEKPIVLVVRRGGIVEINSNKFTIGELREKLRAIYAKRTAKEIYIQADQSLSYGTVADVMATVQGAGISRIGLVTKPKD